METETQPARQRRASATHYALCVRNEGYPASLDLRKIYRLIPADAGDAGLLRVVDESGEDYLYPAEFFIALDLPQIAEQALAGMS